MATEKQIAANRRNAAKSTGPRSAEGKKRSRMNALRHGFSAQLLEFDDPQLGENKVVESKSRNKMRGNLEIDFFRGRHRIQIERVKILSGIDKPEDPKFAMRLTGALKKVAALARYEGRIVAERKRRATALAANLDRDASTAPKSKNCKTNPI